MSRQSANPSAGKRRRPESEPQGRVDAERVILNLIKDKKDLGIWLRDIKQESKLPDPTVNKSLKSLISKNLIKEVVNFQNKGRKHYMAFEFEPSKEITGGDWYVNGVLDQELITVLKRVCLQYLERKVIADLEDVHDVLKRKGIVNFTITSQQVDEILNAMVLDNDIIEVKSTGVGDYRLIPIGKTCYRTASGAGVVKHLKTGAFGSIPCGACPRISVCTPDGVISPATCVYYTKWLNVDF
ncbi:uncharacterized protein LOC127251309 [Andrographis paniculata]|uniref:uncharacterized protein LOC127251309 n=1 Tax=Andrographis paniculata TaxID=175694 RepID=UPI0021E7A207|nr:uncharacterized protein LOC127251309 [Andrographis paniculata]XP_051130926.1 uncharacterized protein LOC127251309 [Andrographis paniculata]